MVNFLANFFNKNKTRLGVVIAAPPAVCQPFLALRPGNATGVHVLATTRDGNDLVADVKQFKPQLVLISPEIEGYRPELVAELVNWPAYPLAVIGLPLVGSPAGVQMTAKGAVGFYHTPLTPAAVERFAREAPTLLEQARERWSKPLLDKHLAQRLIKTVGGTHYKNGVVTFWSAKGGDGKTALAVNTACALSILGGQRTLLIDNDMNCGRVHHHLNILPGQNTILHLASDFLLSGNQIDGKMLKRRVMAVERMLDQRAWVAESNLDVLFGIRNIEQAAADELRGAQGREFMEALIDLAKRMYDYVVVDMGSNTQVGTHFGALAKADVIMFINSSDRTSLAPNRDTLESLVKHGEISLERFRVVLNRYDERDRISLKNVSEYLSLPVTVTVPEDTSREMLAGVNDGRPFVLTHLGKNNPAAEKTLRGLLELTGIIFPPMEEMIAERDGKPKPKKNG